MDNKKNPALCDDVIEQRDQAIRGRTISTFENTFGNIWKKLIKNLPLSLMD